ncbi:MAG: hypothetical protein VR64_21930 [Desulfatitalea sp. BRH_c12]|nr:MAG: hypothetical protein VR64_21930 [Desulfatitalea sp. BRH_c12]
MKKDANASKPKKDSQNSLSNRQPIVMQCYLTEDTGEIVKCRKAEDNYCSAFISPAAKWRLGDCPLADDFLKTKSEKKMADKVRVGQQKQKK